MTNRSMVRTICGAHIEDGKGARDMMLILNSNRTMGLLAMANSVRLD